LVLHKGVQVWKAGDFRLQNQRLDLPIHSEIATRSGAVEVCLTQPLDLHFADELAHPLPGIWLFGGEPNAGCWLREHHLGKMAVQVFDLCLALEAKHDRILTLPSFGDRRVKLRQLL
jgi:hypothetical protein